MILPTAVGLMVGVTALARWSTGWGTKWVVVFGLAFVAVGDGLLRLQHDHVERHPRPFVRL